MKRIIISAAIAMSAAAAYADPITVMTPKANASAEEVALYVAKLDQAVEKVCKDERAPILGVAYYSYQACLRDTRIAVEKSDPTGFYVAHESVGGTVIAAK